MNNSIHYQPLSEDLIRKVYKANGLELTPELLDFEKNYSGKLIHHADFSIRYQTIWGGGFPFNAKLAIIEYEEFTQKDSNFLIRCTDYNTQCPTYYAIDEKGRYYEDYRLIYNSFNDMINKLKANRNL